MVKNKQGIQGAYRLLAYQLVVTILLAMVAIVISGKRDAGSVVLGGLVCIVPNAYFAKKLFQHQGARAAKQIVKNFYKGEAMKLFLTVALFALVFKFFSINPLLFFVAYMVVQLIFWFAPLIVNNKQYRPESDGNDIKY